MDGARVSTGRKHHVQNFIRGDYYHARRDRTLYVETQKRRTKHARCTRECRGKHGFFGGIGKRKNKNGPATALQWSARAHEDDLRNICLPLAQCWCMALLCMMADTDIIGFSFLNMVSDANGTTNNDCTRRHVDIS